MNTCQLQSMFTTIVCQSKYCGKYNRKQWSSIWFYAPYIWSNI